MFPHSFSITTNLPEIWCERNKGSRPRMEAPGLGFPVGTEAALNYRSGTVLAPVTNAPLLLMEH
ncbi:MAG: hypothetical protein R6X16_06155 [Anaerolineae bacterium]